MGSIPTSTPPSTLHIDPPLLNSASPWATTLEDLTALHNSPYTGAVTTRTCLLEGFSHDDSTHQYTFFSAGQSTTHPSHINSDHHTSSTTNGASSHHSSLNTLGYSPITLSEYLGIINEIVGQRHLGTAEETGLPKKPWILSVTGTGDEVAMAYALIANAAEMDEGLRLNMEVNLSCPNIADKPPPAYDEESLTEFLGCLADAKSTYRGRMAEESVPRVGIKVPPYTHRKQFEMVVGCLRRFTTTNSTDNSGGGGPDKSERSILDFITCCNTLGSCLVLDPDQTKPLLNSENGSGVGGMAGAALHSLALGNVATFRHELDRYPETKGVMIIGVGGVEDRQGWRRMRKVGAGAVGIATALGREGVAVFEKIVRADEKGLER